MDNVAAMKIECDKWFEEYQKIKQQLDLPHMDRLRRRFADVQRLLQEHCPDYLESKPPIKPTDEAFDAPILPID